MAILSEKAIESSASSYQTAENHLSGKTRICITNHTTVPIFAALGQKYVSKRHISWTLGNKTGVFVVNIVPYLQKWVVPSAFSIFSKSAWKNM